MLTVKPKQELNDINQTETETTDSRRTHTQRATVFPHSSSIYVCLNSKQSVVKMLADLRCCRRCCCCCSFCVIGVVHSLQYNRIIFAVLALSVYEYDT